MTTPKPPPARARKATGVLIWADGRVEPRDGLCGRTYIILAGLPSKPPPPFKEHRFRLITEEHGVAVYVQLPRVNIDGMVVEMSKKLPVDEQVDRIVKMMVSGEWKGAQSHKELAKEWGCHPRTVGDRAVAASAVVKRIGGPLEDWVLRKLAELEEVKAVAMAHQKAFLVKHGPNVSEVEYAPDPQCNAAVNALKLQLEARGVFVKKTQAVEPDDIDKMSPAEKIAAHEKAIADLRAEQAGETRH